MGENLPIYKLKINPNAEDATGVEFVALVDEPAVNQRVNWVAFNKSAKFAVTNEDKQIVSGVMMVADMPIYRRDNELGEYYVVFDRQTIEQIVHKFFKLDNISNVNMMHNASSIVKGAYLFESFIIDKAKGMVTPQGFDELPDGSWFASYKIEDKKVWADIKEGKFNGFSVEGMFVHELQKQEMSKNNNINQKIMAENKSLVEKLSDIKKILFNEEVAAPAVEQTFTDMKLSDGTIVRVTGDMAAGSTIEAIAEDGTVAPLASGDYEMEDGTKFSVENGVISEVAVVEEAKAAAPVVEADKVDMSKFVSVDDFNKFSADVLAKLDVIAKGNEAKFAEVKDIQKGIVDVMEKITETPAATPTEAKREFKKDSTPFAKLIEITSKLK